MTGDAPRTVEIEQEKNHAPGSQDQEPSKHVRLENVGFRLGNHSGKKTKPESEPPGDAQEEEIIQEHQAFEELTVPLQHGLILPLSGRETVVNVLFHFHFESLTREPGGMALKRRGFEV